MKQVNLRLEDDLIEAIERVRGTAKREPYLRELLRAHFLGATPFKGQPGPDVTRVVSSHQAKRGVAPVPKPGKR